MAGEKQLEKAQRESKEAKEEIEKRKQHTHMLLCRIRELKVRICGSIAFLERFGRLGW